MRVRGYVSTVWGCPYEGKVDSEARDGHRAASSSRWAANQISLGDTIGVGHARPDARILRALLSEFPSRGDRACTSTTRAAPRSRTSSSGSRWAFATSTPRSAAWAAAPTPRRGRQPRDRRPRLHAPRHGHRDRHRPRTPGGSRKSGGEHRRKKIARQGASVGREVAARLRTASLLHVKAAVHLRHKPFRGCTITQRGPVQVFGMTCESPGRGLANPLGDTA